MERKNPRRSLEEAHRTEEIPLYEVGKCKVEQAAKECFNTQKRFSFKKKKKTQERPDSRWMHVSEPSKQFSENKNLPERQWVVVPAGLAVPHQVRALLAQSEKRLRLRATEAPVIPPAENQEEWKWRSLLRCNSVCRASSYCLQRNKQANSGYVEDGRNRLYHNPLDQSDLLVGDISQTSPEKRERCRSKRSFVLCYFNVLQNLLKTPIT